MSDIEVWIVIALITVATFIARSSLWLIGHHINIPKRVQEALRYAPSCALAAIILPDLLLVSDQINTSLYNPKLIAGVAATLFFYVKRDMLLTIFFGMAIFTLMRLYL